MNTPKINTINQEDTDTLIRIRRYLHAHPELSFEESNTANYIEQQLASFGIESVTRCAETGVIALIQGAHPGPTLAFRGDIDALPIIEDSDKPYCSTSPGVMHACGHDVHTTLGLGVAQQLYKQRDQLHGTIKLIFQPAEEAPPQNEPIGAARMVHEGALENPDVDAIFAFHCMPTLDVGKIGFTQGPVWAGSDLVEITLRGKKTHAAYPHSGRDAIVAASQLVMALQTITSRLIDTRQPTVLSFGKIEAGESYNIIADTAKLTGILRSLSSEASQIAHTEIDRITHGIAQATGTTAEITITKGARLVANNVNLEARCVQHMREALGDQALVHHLPQLGAEDFAAFSQAVPACYLFLGIRNESKGITHMLHTPKFDVDEDCISLGVQAMSHAMLQIGQRWDDLSLNQN
mgnify:CR=1 FL=1